MAAFHKVATERDPPGVAAAETAASYTVATECDEVKLKDRLFIWRFPNFSGMRIAMPLQIKGEVEISISP